MPELSGLVMSEKTRTGTRLNAGDLAPEFVLADVWGKKTSLLDFRGKSWVFLVFNRGFA